MASSDEAAEAVGQGAQRGSNAGATGDASGGPAQSRRTRTKGQAEEVMDELAQETKRVTLLERQEQQLKGQKHVSRLLFVFGIVDDRKTQAMVEHEFTAWREKQEGADEVTGLLLFLGQAAMSFLEGPSELLFKAIELFHGLTLEVVAAPPMPLPPADMRGSAPATKIEVAGPAPTPRAALISAVRVLYFTELHGVRASVGWCSFVSQAKLQSGGAQVAEEPHEMVFGVYKKMLLTCMKAQGQAGGDTNPETLQTHYRKLGDFMPAPDEAVMLLGKQVADNFFSFTEFQKVFMKPFQLVLNSELLWPMPPPLSY